MKKNLFLLLTLGVFLGFAGCREVNPPTPDPDKKDTTHVDPAPSKYSFPRKHLIEHFTGETCGYCPIGYMALWEYTESHENTIWVSHHKGYQNDQYTITASGSVMRTCGVESAPSCALDRAPIKSKGNAAAGQQDIVSSATKPCFHPMALSQSMGYKLQTVLVDTALVSVVLDYEYNGGELKLHVSGQSLDSNLSSIKLSVCLTESGMLGKQADYNFSFEGWSEYRHVHVPRVYLSTALGDELPIVEGKYDTTYVTTLKSDWNAENMSIVAYVTDGSNKPVLNAETAPVIKGGKGADHQQPEGVKMKEVPEEYPETGMSIKDAYGTSELAMSDAILVKVDVQNNSALWVAQLVGNQIYNYSEQGQNYKFMPIGMIYFIADAKADATSLVGTYPVEDSGNNGTVMASYLDYTYAEIAGSVVAMAEQSYLMQGQLAFLYQWRVMSGSMTITENSISLDVKTAAKTDIRLNFTGKYDVEDATVSTPGTGSVKQMPLKKKNYQAPHFTWHAPMAL